MNVVSSIADLWDVDVTIGLTTHTKHRHIPSPVSPDFEAPQATATLTFSPVALAAAVARTATTRQARPQLLAGLQKSALAQLECLISNTPVFELMADFADLADTERTLFTARCGAGITDLYMNSLGYVWRANAACLSNALDPHADFLYDGGNAGGHGVVLAEAHGSFASNATAKTVAAQAKRKYARQVKPYLNMRSSFGHVIHGYSVAFGSKPGASGAFLSVAETRIPKPRKKAPPPLSQPPFSRSVTAQMALATHRSNFLLMGTNSVVYWIDWINAAGEFPVESGPVTFVRFPYAGRWYLGDAFSIWPALRRYGWWHGELWNGPNWRRLAIRDTILRGLLGESIAWFVMEETACRTFLDSLTGVIRTGGGDRPARLDLPSFDPAGFGIGEDSGGRRADGSDYNYALFRDGLAFVGDPFRPRKFETRRWLPKEGFES